MLCLRLPELQDVCERLGLRKSGRKAEVQQRILAVLGDSTHQASATTAARMQQACQTITSIYSLFYTAALSGPAGGVKRPRLSDGGGAQAATAAAVAAALGGAQHGNVLGGGAANTAIRCVCGMMVGGSCMPGCRCSPPCSCSCCCCLPTARCVLVSTRWSMLLHPPPPSMPLSHTSALPSRSG